MKVGKIEQLTNADNISKSEFKRITAQTGIRQHKKAIVTGTDGNKMLSNHDGKGWVGSEGQKKIYFASEYIIDFEYID